MKLISRILIFFLLLSSTAQSEQASTATSKTTASKTTTSKPKNLIVLVGDGMGPQQIGLAALYAKEAPKGAHSLAIERFLSLIHI